MYSVVNEILNSKDTVEIDLVFYDVTQAYDSLWMEHSLLDLFNTGVKNNVINLLHKLNKKATIQIKTPVGISDKMEIKDIIMQGETISSIVCTTTVDKIDRDCKLPAYEYKSVVKIPKLSFVDDILDVTKCGEETIRMNNYTTEEINKRKLQFSKDKCVRLHVSSKKAIKQKQNDSCKSVYIDEWKVEKEKNGSKIKLKDSHVGKAELKTVTSHLYLGDLVKSDGSNKDNVLAKAAKGRAVARDIIHILNNLHLREFYFDALKLMRESMLISVLTNNLEVSLNMTASEIKILDDVDLMLLRGAMQTSSKSSRCLLLLELGLVSVEFTIKKKRLGYLYELLTTDIPSLAKQIFDQQLQNPARGDWINLVTKDLKDLNINLSFSEILMLTKQKFKQTVKLACRESCFKQLISDKQRLSKGKEIIYFKFETQNYFKPQSCLSTETMRRIYHTRCREIYLKCNFPASFGDNKCISPCSVGQDNERHIYSCKYFSNQNELLIRNNSFEEIFENNVQNQIDVVNILYSRLEVRKTFLNSASPDGVPLDPRGAGARALPRLGIREAKQKFAKINKRNKTRCIKK